ELDGEMMKVSILETVQRRRIERDTVRRGRVVQNPGVGASGHRDAVEGIGDGEYVLESPRHGAAAGATSKYKRTVDVEEDEGRSARPSLRRERCRRAAPWPTALRRS